MQDSNSIIISSLREDLQLLRQEHEGFKERVFDNLLKAITESNENPDHDFKFPCFEYDCQGSVMVRDGHLHCDECDDPTPYCDHQHYCGPCRRSGNTGETVAADCFGNARCITCHGYCPGCYDGLEPTDTPQSQLTALGEWLGIDWGEFRPGNPETGPAFVAYLHENNPDKARALYLIAIREHIQSGREDEFPCFADTCEYGDLVVSVDGRIACDNDACEVNRIDLAPYETAD